MSYKLDKPIMVDTTSYFVWGFGYIFGIILFSQEPLVIMASAISSTLQFWVVYYVKKYNKTLADKMKN